MSYHPKLSNTLYPGIATFNPSHFNLNQGNVSLVSLGSPPPWNLISTTTISSSIITVDFASLSPAYQEFYLSLDRVVTTAKDIISIRFSVNNGISFLNCNYQLNSGSSSLFGYNTYLRYTNTSSLNDKTGSLYINNGAIKSFCFSGGDYQAASNGGFTAGTIFSSTPITFIRLQTSGSTALTGGIVSLYGR